MQIAGDYSFTARKNPTNGYDGKTGKSTTTPRIVAGNESFLTEDDPRVRALNY